MADTTPNKIILAIAALSTFLVTFMGSSVNIALPSISNDLQIDAVMVNWVSTAYLLATATCLLPFGRLADIYGRKKILSIGVTVFTAASIAILFITSAGELIALRVVQGVGSAMIATTGIAIITSVFPSHERGRALGINIMATYLGLSLGPVLGGTLTESFGWRSIFMVVIPMGITAIPLIMYKIRGEWAESKGEKFDLAGSVIYGISLVAIIYGFSTLPGAMGVILVTGGVFGIVAFVRRERNIESPLFNVRLFGKNRMFVLSNVTHLLSYTTTFSIAFLLSLYLQYIKGLSPQSAGLVLVTMAAVQSGFATVAGKLSDRFEPRILGTVGLALISIGLSRLILLDSNTSIGSIIAILVLIGFGRALFIPPNTNAIMTSVNRRDYGVASASLATMRQVGMTFSMGITILLFAVGIGRVEITPQYYPAFLDITKTAFTIFTIICIIAIPLSIKRGNIHQHM